MKRQLLFVCVGVSLFGTGIAVGQRTLSPDQELLEAYSEAEDSAAGITKMMNVYAKMPGNALATKQAARLAYVAGQRGNTGPGFNALIMQNQKIIEQNERIIKLLEKKK